MPATIVGALIFVLLVAMPVFAAESLLFETWSESYFNPSNTDGFILGHRPQYTTEYFECSRQAQELIAEEARLRDRQCDFAPDSGVRTRCRRDNQLRGIDQHLAGLDQVIRDRQPWGEMEAGRSRATAVKAAEELAKTCAPATCEIAKRKKNELLKDLKPLLQCPPVANRPLDVDPSFKTFQLPADPGG